MVRLSKTTMRKLGNYATEKYNNLNIYDIYKGPPCFGGFLIDRARGLKYNVSFGSVKLNKCPIHYYIYVGASRDGYHAVAVIVDTIKNEWTIIDPNGESGFLNHPSGGLINPYYRNSLKIKSRLYTLYRRHFDYVTLKCPRRIYGLHSIIAKGGGGICLSMSITFVERLYRRIGKIQQNLYEVAFSNTPTPISKTGVGNLNMIKRAALAMKKKNKRV